MPITENRSYKTVERLMAISEEIQHHEGKRQVSEAPPIPMNSLFYYSWPMLAHFQAKLLKIRKE